MKYSLCEIKDIIKCRDFSGILEADGILGKMIEGFNLSIRYLFIVIFNINDVSSTLTVVRDCHKHILYDIIKDSLSRKPIGSVAQFQGIL